MTRRPEAQALMRAARKDEPLDKGLMEIASWAMRSGLAIGFTVGALLAGCVATARPARPARTDPPHAHPLPPEAQVTQPTCGCGRPIPDTAYRCSACGAMLKRKLEDVARIAGDITITVAKLSRIAGGAGRPDDLGWWKEGDALEAIPMPVNLDAAQRHDAAVGELMSWARLIIEDRGAFPQVYWTDGQPGPLTPEQHPLRRVTALLSANVEWLRHQSFADEAWPALLAACGELVRIIDARPKDDLIGMCGCGTALYGPRCGRCGAEHDIAEARADMETKLREAAVTASEAARWVAWMGLSSDTARLRKLIWAWADRGHIAAVDAGPRYRFGDVLERVMQSPAIRAA